MAPFESIQSPICRPTHLRPRPHLLLHTHGRLMNQSSRWSMKKVDITSMNTSHLVPRTRNLQKNRPPSSNYVLCLRSSQKESRTYSCWRLLRSPSNAKKAHKTQNKASLRTMSNKHQPRRPKEHRHTPFRHTIRRHQSRHHVSHSKQKTTTRNALAHFGCMPPEKTDNHRTKTTRKHLSQAHITSTEAQGNKAHSRKKVTSVDSHKHSITRSQRTKTPRPAQVSQTRADRRL